MNPERLHQVQRLFHATLKQEPAKRAAFLIMECGDDEALRDAVESLLSHHEQAKSFIELPATVAAAAIFDDEKVGTLSGQSVGRYQVLGLLGTGGMGEVYLAQDTSLGRRVALKLLPALYTQDADRLRRFEQEARTASALNHPNIITIYEIGHLEGNHFIATEYLEGATLRSHLATTRIKVPEAVDIALQVASALAAAHAKGVVHRDIKPENLMVLKEDYSLHRENCLKVLDFGIAKLTEVSSHDHEAPTKPLINTNQGVVLGTVSYMSPEQARGTVVDARTDIWSLGVVLYEMLEGKIPFQGETAEDVRAAILRDTPSALSADIPERLKWIVEKALRKEREDRYQTAREFFSDLRELQKQRLSYEVLIDHSLTPQSSDGESIASSIAKGSTHQTVPPATSSAEFIVGEIKRHKLGFVVASAVLLLAIVAIGYGLITFWKRNRTSPNKSSASMKITGLTDSGKATAAAVSPDGNYVVYALENEGQQSLWLRQVSPTSEREIVAPASIFIRGPTFSEDGNVIYYVASDRESVFGSAVLYQVPTLGGTPRKVLARVSSPITFSPDGDRFAFVRSENSSGATALIISNADGTGERILAEHKDKGFFSDSGPAWSPDGKIIACGAGIDPNGIYQTVVEVSVENGSEKPITSYKGWTGAVDRVTWLQDGSGLMVVAASDLTTGFQIWHLGYPSGDVRRITNDLNTYGIESLTLSVDSSILAAVQRDQTANFWLMKVNEDASRARQVTNGRFSGGGGLAWTPEGKIMFPRTTGDVRDLWTMDQDGTNLRQFTADAPWEAFPIFSRDGRYLVFNSNRINISHIWRFDADGTNPKQLTEGNSDDYSPVLTPDAKWVLFASWRSGKLATWKVSIDGGDPVQLARQTSPWPAVSADGKMFASGYHDDDPNSQWHLAIYPIEGGEALRLFDITATVGFGPGLTWAPDGQALFYVDTRNGVSNIWSQPIEGGPPRQLTNFKSDLIFRFALSPDGKLLALKRGTQTRDVVIIRNFL